MPHRVDFLDESLVAGGPAEGSEAVPWSGFFGKRRSERYDLRLNAIVEGARGTYRAVVHDVSRGGVLLEIRDPAFAAPGEAEDLLRYAARVAFALGRGFRLRVGKELATPLLRVVRMAAAVERDLARNLLGCRFERPLTAEECAAIGLPPDG
jgi:hypothetical protein